MNGYIIKDVKVLERARDILGHAFVEDNFKIDMFSQCSLSENWPHIPSYFRIALCQKINYFDVGSELADVILEDKIPYVRLIARYSCYRRNEREKHCVSDKFTSDNLYVETKDINIKTEFWSQSKGFQISFMRLHNSLHYIADIMDAWEKNRATISDKDLYDVLDAFITSRFVLEQFEYGEKLYYSPNGERVSKIWSKVPIMPEKVAQRVVQAFPIFGYGSAGLDDETALSFPLHYQVILAKRPDAPLFQMRAQNFRNLLNKAKNDTLEKDDNPMFWIMYNFDLSIEDVDDIISLNPKTRCVFLLAIALSDSVSPFLYSVCEWQYNLDDMRRENHFGFEDAKIANKSLQRWKDSLRKWRDSAISTKIDLNPEEIYITKEEVDIKLWDSVVWRIERGSSTFGLEWLEAYVVEGDVWATFRSAYVAKLTDRSIYNIIWESLRTQLLQHRTDAGYLYTQLKNNVGSIHHKLASLEDGVRSISSNSRLHSSESDSILEMIKSIKDEMRAEISALNRASVELENNFQQQKKSLEKIGAQTSAKRTKILLGLIIISQILVLAAFTQ